MQLLGSKATAALLAAALLLVAGCGGAGGGGADGGASEGSDEQGTGETGAGESESEESGDGEAEADADVRWERVSADGAPEDVARWVETHRGQVGVFQKVSGDAAYVLVSWGEKPTGGYTVRVRDVQPVGADTLRIAVHLREPAEDDVVTQAITYPQDLIAITPARHYELETRFEGATFMKNDAFEVDEPTPFALVDGSLRVAGRARVFEATFQATLEDGHVVLARRVVQVADGAPAWAPFAFEIAPEQTATSPHGTLLIYEESARDGSMTHTLAIPVRFAHWE